MTPAGKHHRKRQRRRHASNAPNTTSSINTDLIGNTAAKVAVRDSTDWTEAFAPATRAFLNSGEIVDKMRNEYVLAKPYRHCILGRNTSDFKQSVPSLSGVIDDALLCAAREAGLNLISFREKETDIYRVHQCGDLANLDGLPVSEKEQLEPLLRVRNAIYSPEFRAAVAKVAGCGPLSGKKVDCSLNAYVPGDHLLCHDDVIGSRRVSYILYLVPRDWEPRRGGGLEFYPLAPNGNSDSNSNGDGNGNGNGTITGERKKRKKQSKSSIDTLPDTAAVSNVNDPATSPTLIFYPEWNTMGFWQVHPGVSYHAVQEVFDCNASGDEAVRLSLSGWFHAALPGEPGFGTPEHRAAEEMYQKLASVATLQQLELSTAKQDRSFCSVAEEISSMVSPDLLFSDDDREYLSAVIRPELLSDEFIGRIRQQLLVNSDRGRACANLQLPAFVRPEVFEEMWSAFAASEENLRLALDEKDPKSVVDERLLKMPRVSSSENTITQEKKNKKKRRTTEDSKSDASVPPTLAETAGENAALVRAPSYYNAGITERWTLFGNPQQQRYLRLSDSWVLGRTRADRQNDNTHDRFADHLEQVQRVLSSPAFSRWVQAFFAVEGGRAPFLVDARRVVVRRFRQGLDYTLAGNPDDDFAAADEVSPESTAKSACLLDATWCLIKPFKPGSKLSTGAKHSRWSSGDAGGYVCYMDKGRAEDAMASEAGKDPAEFRADEADDSVTSHYPVTNVLTFQLRPRTRKTLTFVKYVSDSAPSSRVDIAAQFSLNKS